ncbi:MAG: Fe-S-cluster-containing hydrogenase component 1 [Acidobacteria bacterium]|nr:Fe-S-cluster-containing hydrogenase component 1 [Acidobacteriota bacterium]
MPGGKKAESEKAAAKKKFSRRDFLVSSGTVVAVDALIATTPASAALAATTSPSPAAVKETPASKGYLVYDSKKCCNCTTCMLSCSLTHYGVQSLSLSRIQIMHDSFGKFPNDVIVAPCRQCVTPPCVINCPVGAAYVDTKNGNVRRIDSKKCIGCKTCIKMCPQQPHRTVWNQAEKKSSKCDLCIDTPYWNEKGGIGGKQACVESCPMKAIKFVAETPNQEETDGYNVNLRNDHWLNLGLVDNSTIIPPRMKMQASAKKPAFKPAPKPKE